MFYLSLFNFSSATFANATNSKLDMLTSRVDGMMACNRRVTDKVSDLLSDHTALRLDCQTHFSMMDAPAPSMFNF